MLNLEAIRGSVELDLHCECKCIPLVGQRQVIVPLRDKFNECSYLWVCIWFQHNCYSPHFFVILGCYTVYKSLKFPLVRWNQKSAVRRITRSSSVQCFLMHNDQWCDIFIPFHFELQAKKTLKMCCSIHIVVLNNYNDVEWRKQKKLHFHAWWQTDWIWGSLYMTSGHNVGLWSMLWQWSCTVGCASVLHHITLAELN